MSVNHYDKTTGQLTRVAGPAGELSFTGTLSQWNNLTTQQKAVYDGKKVFITDDYIQNIPVMIGASASEDGYKGIVPTPHAGDENKVLHGDGAFKDKFTSVTITHSGTNREDLNSCAQYINEDNFENVTINWGGYIYKPSHYDGTYFKFHFVRVDTNKISYGGIAIASTGSVAVSVDTTASATTFTNITTNNNSRDITIIMPS